MKWNYLTGQGHARWFCCFNHLIAAKQVFSLLKNSFQEQQFSTLEDYIETSIQFMIFFFFFEKTRVMGQHETNGLTLLMGQHHETNRYKT